MKNNTRKILAVCALLIIVFITAFSAYALNEKDNLVVDDAEQAVESSDNSSSGKAYAAAVCVGLAAAAGAVGMALSISKSLESIARQPEAKGDIRANLMLGLVFIETAIIYALIIAILIIFVL